MDNPQALIDPRLLNRYGFDFSRCRMLFDPDPKRPATIQLNSVDNYIAYHVVSLMETLRARPEAPPLRVVVLGCTHFPFYADAFRHQLARLYDCQEGGTYVYRRWMSRHIDIVDPAQSTARRLYLALARSGKLRARTPVGALRAAFYLSVPDRDHPGVQLDAEGWFSYDYKYGRGPAAAGTDVRYVPLDPARIGPGVTGRLSRRVPLSWALLQRFLAELK
ncbi:MAG TPA: hypothetical protein EYH34_02895 [Planctomycetes bacterium]|nr:hypothetical protein [Planctomycetota bacterium]